MNQPTSRGLPIGVIPAQAIEIALIRTMRAAAILLILLSILGTFYGMRGMQAPLATPVQIAIDLWGAPLTILAALFLQGLLSLVQWGARQLARADRRWWFVYLGALFLSVYWNWSAYGAPMIALGVAWLLAFFIVLSGDILPELALIKG